MKTTTKQQEPTVFERKDSMRCEGKERFKAVKLTMGSTGWRILNFVGVSADRPNGWEVFSNRGLTRNQARIELLGIKS